MFLVHSKARRNACAYARRVRPAAEEGIVLMRILRSNASRIETKLARQPRMLLRLKGQREIPRHSHCRNACRKTRWQLLLSPSPFSGWPCPRETLFKEQGVMLIERGECAVGPLKPDRVLVHFAFETAHTCCGDVCLLPSRMNKHDRDFSS